uniref:NADPH:adrenodoxin oxidoreductase, mitochondrial n=1 Tax=Sinocyclocheilus rhinocerous TaxID=307959 RepID=A0A673INE2_9TELE
ARCVCVNMYIYIYYTHTQRKTSVCGLSSPSGPRVCIVGGGPAGFYTAQQLLKARRDAVVDIYERLPVIILRSRSGLRLVTNVINTFTQTAQHERCSFHGNVNVGKDVTIDELQQAYHTKPQHNTEGNRSMGIPGEDLAGVFSAKDFVGWYNGLPSNKEPRPDLSCETALVLGQGNVALDVARILLDTDITQNALEALAGSKVRRVLIVGQRGPLQIACTIKELREMVNLPNTRADMLPADFEGIAEALKGKNIKKLMMMKTVKEGRDEKAEKCWGFRFFRSPVEILAGADGKRAAGIRLALNKLESACACACACSDPTGQLEDVDCGLIISSIGYKSIPIDPAVPFDPQKAIVPNEMGRVQDTAGLYCSGWVKRGPTGVIATTMNDSFDTACVLIQDMEAGKLDVSANKPGAQAITALRQTRGVRTVLFSQWEKINAEEEKRGRSLGKPREKLLDVNQMLKIA